MNRLHDTVSTLANGPSADELARRSDPVQDIADAHGEIVGQAIWRDDTQRWWTTDNRWRTRGRHTTYAQAEASVRRRTLAPTREAAERLR